MHFPPKIPHFAGPDVESLYGWHSMWPCGYLLSSSESFRKEYVYLPQTSSTFPAKEPATSHKRAEHIPPNSPVSPPRLL